MRRLLVLAAIGSIVAPFDAQARVRWSTPGSYRLRVAGLSAFDLDASGTDTGQRVRGRHRLRIDPTIELGPVTVYLQVDVLTGQIFGDVNTVGARFVERRHGEPDDRYDGWTTVEPRQAWLELDIRSLRVEAGQMASGWGTPPGASWPATARTTRPPSATAGSSASAIAGAAIWCSA